MKEAITPEQYINWVQDTFGDTNVREEEFQAIIVGAPNPKCALSIVFSNFRNQSDDNEEAWHHSALTLIKFLTDLTYNTQKKIESLNEKNKKLEAANDFLADEYKKLSK